MLEQSAAVDAARSKLSASDKLTRPCTTGSNVDTIVDPSLNPDTLLTLIVLDDIHDDALWPLLETLHRGLASTTQMPARSIVTLDAPVVGVFVALTLLTPADSPP